MEPTVIESSFSFLAWIGIGVAALLIGWFVVWLFGGMVDVGAASIERPRQRHGQPKADMGFGIESTTLPVYEAREIAGIAMWQIRKLLSLGTADLETISDVNRWQGVHDKLSMRLHKVALALHARREALAIAQGDAFVPGWLQPDTEVEPPVVTGSLHA